MLRLRLLGDFVVEVEGQVFRRLRAQKYSYLLAYLALSPDQAHTRDSLVDLFWQDEPVDKARTCLRTALSSLRRQLGCPDLFMDGPRDSVRINSERVVTDVAEFESAALAGDPNAAALYGGQLLPACFDAWAFDLRDRLEGLYNGLPDKDAGVPRHQAKGTTDKPSAKRAVVRTQPKLPSPITRFYGRRIELEQIVRLLESGESRLITLTGLGGVGKTRLAIETGKRISLRIVFTDASDCKSLDTLVSALADALGLDKSVGSATKQMISQALSAAPTVLIFDNMEQAVSDENNRWLLALLESIPSLAVLTTSRIPLGLEGERVLTLSSLNLNDAVELFLDRARHALPDFADSAALPELCERLDRFPLAIELCASWANVLSSKRMLEGLSARFELTTAKRRTTADRHYSLYAVLEWSCPPDSRLREHLGMLSVLRGWWTLEATEAILGKEAPSILDACCERALLNSGIVGGGVRFHMLDSVRDFAVEFADAERLHEARSRHNAFFSKLAIDTAWEYERRPIEAVRVLELEHPNILAAFEFGLRADGSTLEMSVLQFKDVRFLWAVRGYKSAIDSCIALLANRIDEPLSGYSHAAVLEAAGEHAFTGGDFESALQFQNRAIDAATQIGHLGLLRSTLESQAVTFQRLNDWDSAASCYERAMATLPPTDVESYQVILANVAGMYLHRLQDFERAEPLYRQLLAFWNDREDGEIHVAVMRRCLGICAMMRGEQEEAERLLMLAIPIFEQVGQTTRVVAALKELSQCLEAQGRMGDAAEVTLRWQELAPPEETH